MTEPVYQAGAAGYDEVFGRVTRSFLPALLKAAHLRSGQHVLDVATGTGAAAEAALAVVGPSGSVVAGDVSPHMLEIARKNMKHLPIRFEAFDAHDLPFPDGSFDAIICQLGLMFFDDPARALGEFYRVLRPGGWAAVSVNSIPERSLFLRVGIAIAHHVPAKAELFERSFSIRDTKRLRALFEGAGFRDSSMHSEDRPVAFASFDDYFSGIEKGATVSGQEYVLLPDDLRRAVREEVRRGLPHADGPGPITISMEVLVGCGCK